MLTNAQLPERLEPEHARLAQQAAALARLSSVVGQAAGKDHKALETLKKIDNILPLLGSLHTNALRREEQSRYDTAALLRYRCLELISQHRLASHGVLTEQPDLDGLRQRVPSIDQDYRRVELELGLNPRGLPNRPHRGGTYGSLSLFNGYLLLAALADELVGGYPLNDIRFRSEARNKSILAHGYRLITRDEYERFAEVVHVMLDRLFGLLAQDRADWEAPYRFVSL
jgi:CRISPR-associated protein (TIGR02710 family)